MTDKQYIKPRDGLTVRDPDAGGAPLPAFGKGIVWSSYWERRKADGDIEPTTQKAIDAAAKAAEPAPTEQKQGAVA